MIKIAAPLSTLLTATPGRAMPTGANGFAQLLAGVPAGLNVAAASGKPAPVAAVGGNGLPTPATAGSTQVVIGVASMPTICPIAESDPAPTTDAPFVRPSANPRPPRLPVAVDDTPAPAAAERRPATVDPRGSRGESGDPHRNPVATDAAADPQDETPIVADLTDDTPVNDESSADASTLGGCEVILDPLPLLGDLLPAMVPTAPAAGSPSTGDAPPSCALPIGRPHASSAKAPPALLTGAEPVPATDALPITSSAPAADAVTTGDPLAATDPQVAGAPQPVDRDSGSSRLASTVAPSPAAPVRATASLPNARSARVAQRIVPADGTVTPVTLASMQMVATTKVAGIATAPATALSTPTAKSQSAQGVPDAATKVRPMAFVPQEVKRSDAGKPGSMAPALAESPLAGPTTASDQAPTTDDAPVAASILSPVGIEPVSAPAVSLAPPPSQPPLPFAKSPGEAPAATAAPSMSAPLAATAPFLPPESIAAVASIAPIVTEVPPLVIPAGAGTLSPAPDTIAAAPPPGEAIAAAMPRTPVESSPRLARNGEVRVGTTAPAASVFATAIGAADRQERVAAIANPVATALDSAAPRREDNAQAPLGDVMSRLLGTSGSAPVAPTATGDQPSLDLADHRWPTAMVDHIERLRDAAAEWADAQSTRIRVMPDALGSIDVTLRRHDDGAVQVRLDADRPATQALLADAAPELTRLAEQRGLRLAEPTGSSADAGGSTTGFAGDSWRGQQGDQRRPATPSRPASATLFTDEAEAADGRVA